MLQCYLIILHQMSKPNCFLKYQVIFWRLSITHIGYFAHGQMPKPLSFLYLNGKVYCFEISKCVLSLHQMVRYVSKLRSVAVKYYNPYFTWHKTMFSSTYNNLCPSDFYRVTFVKPITNLNHTHAFKISRRRNSVYCVVFTELGLFTFKEVFKLSTYFMLQMHHLPNRIFCRTRLLQFSHYILHY